MLIYTNKFPIARSYPCIQPDSLILEKDIPEIIPVGTAFEVSWASGMDVALKSKGKYISVSCEVFNTCFIETDMEI